MARARRVRSHSMVVPWAPGRGRPLGLALLGVLALAGAPGARRAPTPVPDAVTNDLRAIAGRLADGRYALSLELRRATWHPNAPTALDVDVPAFAESGGPASVPGPLIRVPAGTRMHITVRNALSQRATVHGLHDHAGGRDSVVLAPGEQRVLDFTVTQPGTFAYFARTNDAPTLFSRRDDSQLMGVFVVDSAGHDSRREHARERLLVITAWDDSLPNPSSPYGPRQVYAINGRSWPFTERLSYQQGDSVRWRVLNLSLHTHPMHLHGTYFRVTHRGTPFTDTALHDSARLVVTENLTAGASMTMTWKADRAGNWLFHCHTINHIDEALRLGEAAGAHPTHANVTDVMAGLVMGISVRATPDTGPAATTGSAGAGEGVGVAPRRRLRLFVTERAGAGDGTPSLSYVLQRDGNEPAADSLELPGSTLELRQDEPTAITVVNRSRQHTAVHWHGMELDSYFDGVAGWSGGDARTAPVIAPRDSFVVHMTPPRAGTFIYHTHAGELAQLTGGLYGAMIVRSPAEPADPNERVFVLSDSTLVPLAGRTPPSMINGRREPAPIDLRAGQAHRLRFISIGAVTRKQVRLLDGATVLRWTPVAKDGADLPPALRRERASEHLLFAGETLDVTFTPTRAGLLVLEVTATSGPSIVTRVPVRVGP